MAFTIPTFNLTCNVYRWILPPGPLSVVSLSPDCNLAFSRRAATGILDSSDTIDYQGIMFLLVPKLTDIRSQVCYSAVSDKTDLIECPAGSGRIYAVQSVDDVGKGFANEFRCAVIRQTYAYGLWPSPIP